MTKHRSFHPTTLTALEDRVVLSQVAPAPTALVQPVTNPPVPLPGHVLSLNGTISGTFVTTTNSPISLGNGTTTTFQGSGTITGLGQVNVTGSLVTLISPSGQITTQETFTLTNAEGTVTIQINQLSAVLGTPQTASSPFTIVKAPFTIVKATGAFQGDTGTGTANLQMFAELVPVNPPSVSRGVFTLTLQSDPPVV